ncbi:hypothetical protein DFH09DRAFT_1106332 [Mycena vulgaris]|nr:hypothetical protein DFH09DRAFT_1106332 [Mycena vulgaris]
MSTPDSKSATAATWEGISVEGKPTWVLPTPFKVYSSECLNLKDKDNPCLREAVASGDIPVENFAEMTSQASPPHQSAVLFLYFSRKWRRRKGRRPMNRSSSNLAPRSKGQKRLRSSARSVNKSVISSGVLLIPFLLTSETQRKCRYLQAHTRSADEPITSLTFFLSLTFVTSVSFVSPYHFDFNPRSELRELQQQASRHTALKVYCINIRAKHHQHSNLLLPDWIRACSGRCGSSIESSGRWSLVP